MSVAPLESTVVSGWSYAAITTEDDGRVLIVGTCVHPLGAAAYAVAHGPGARVVKLPPDATQAIFDIIAGHAQELDDGERESIGMACERVLEREEC